MSVYNFMIERVLGMDSIEINLPNGKKLVVDLCDADRDPPEVFVSIMDTNTKFVQDICMVRPNEDKVECFIWADHNDEGWTDNYDIEIYNGEEE